MTSEVEHVVELGVILVTLSGHVSNDEMLAVGEKGFALAAEVGTWRFLSDCTDLVTGPTIVYQQAHAAQNSRDSMSSWPRSAS